MKNAKSDIDFAAAQSEFAAAWRRRSRRDPKLRTGRAPRRSGLSPSTVKALQRREQRRPPQE
jgi:hypothetical protein